MTKFYKRSKSFDVFHSNATTFKKRRKGCPILKTWLHQDFYLFIFSIGCRTIKRGLNYMLERSKYSYLFPTVFLSTGISGIPPEIISGDFFP